MRRTLAFAAITLLAFALGADAQTRRPTTPQRRITQPPLRRPDRGYVTFGAALQISPTSLSDSAHPIEFAEPATVDTRVRANGIPGFDVAAAIRTKYMVRQRPLSVGVALSHFRKSTDGAISAQVPHPFSFNRFRPVSGDAGLGRRETAVHIQAIWPERTIRDWQLSLAAGPSVFRVSQDLVDDVTVTQTYPFDTATFAGAVKQSRSATRLGFNVGAIGDRPLTRTLGLRLTMEFSRAGIRLPSPDGRRTSATAGGLRLGGGVMWKF